MPPCGQKFLWSLRTILNEKSCYVTLRGPCRIWLCNFSLGSPPTGQLHFSSRTRTVVGLIQQMISHQKRNCYLSLSVLQEKHSGYCIPTFLLGCLPLERLICRKRWGNFGEISTLKIVCYLITAMQEAKISKEAG